MTAPIQSVASVAAAWIELGGRDVDLSRLKVEVAPNDPQLSDYPGGTPAVLRRVNDGFHQLLWRVPGATPEVPTGSVCVFDFVIRGGEPDKEGPEPMERNLIGLESFPGTEPLRGQRKAKGVTTIPLAEGGSALLFDADEDGNGPVYRAPLFAVGSAESYEVSFRYSIDQGEAHPRYNLTFFSWLNFLDADGEPVGREMVHSTKVSETDGWVEVKRMIIAPSEASRAYLDLRNGSTVAESVRVADVRITPVTLPNALFADGSREGGHQRWFDLGPSKTEAWGDFVALTPAERYHPERGWGFTRLVKPVAVDNLRLDNLGRDFITAAAAEFRVDLPDGEYLVWFLSGDIGKSSDSVRRFFFDQELEVNAQTVLRRDPQPSKSIPEEFVASYQHFWLPGMDYYETFIQARFQEHTALVRVTDGQLRVRWKNLPLAAIVIEPGSDRDRFSGVIAKLQRERRRDTRISEVSSTASSSPVRPTEQESDRGVVFFRKPVGNPILPTDTPAPGERISRLEASVAKGENRSVWFSLHALKDGQAVSVHVSPLRGEGQVLDASQAQLRIARYIFRNRNHSAAASPDYRYEISAFPLDRPRAVPLVKGHNWTWCIELDIPRDSLPGNYQGTVAVTGTDGTTVAELPLTVRVLPFELEPLPILQGYYYQPSEPWYALFWGKNIYGAKLKDDPALLKIIAENERRELAFMKSLGLNSVAMSDDLRGDLVYRDGEVTLAPGDRLSFWMELYKEAGMGPMPWYGFYPIGSATGSANRLSWLDPSLQPPHTDRWFKAYRSLAGNVARHAREQGWPEILFYISDERSNYGREGAEMGVRLGEALRGMDGIRTIASMNGPAERIMVPSVDIAMPNFAFPLDDGIFDLMEQSGTELWLYNCGAQRVALGLWTWRMGVKGRFQWIYRSQCPDPWDDLGGRSLSRYSIAYPGPDGPVPTLASATLRAAINDHRYMATLEKLVAQRRGDSRFAAEVRSAEAFVGYLRERLPVDVRRLMNRKADAKEAGGELQGEFASDEAMDRLRQAMARLILDLQPQSPNAQAPRKPDVH